LRNLLGDQRRVFERAAGWAYFSRAVVSLRFVARIFGASVSARVFAGPVPCACAAGIFLCLSTPLRA
jgi:hypothetical protein